MFRPGVYGQVGFRNHHDTADTVGTELMEVRADNCGFGNTRTSYQNFFNSLYVIEEFGIAPVKLKQQVST